MTYLLNYNLLGNKEGVQKKAAQGTASLCMEICGEDEIRTRGTNCSVRRFSKPVVSATHPPLQSFRSSFQTQNAREGKGTKKKLFYKPCPPDIKRVLFL